MGENRLANVSLLSTGSVASPVIQATWRSDLADGLRSGGLVQGFSRRPGVHTKHGVDMGVLEESGTTRSAKERRIGPGGKPSSQKSPRRAVVGSRLGVGTLCQPDQYS
ncbi:hypothetical protein JTB14_005893 [Gonioctena quinquepunctata]|nr:hypothetical protein JTB14_005893 [Gonioctena quinquepunctata]